MNISIEEYEQLKLKLSKNHEIAEDIDLVSGVKTFWAIRTKKNGKTIEVTKSCQFQEPIKNIVEVKENVEKMFLECVSKDGDWESNDDPVARTVRFISPSKSECRCFTLFVLKGLDKKFIKGFVTPQQRKNKRI